MKKVYITRDPDRNPERVTTISNDILNIPLHNDTATLLLIQIIRQPNDYEFTTDEGIRLTGHHSNAVRTACDVLERNGFLTRIPISRNKVEYHWYESPSLNHDFIQGKVINKPNKEKQRRPKSPKGNHLERSIKKTISSIEKAQGCLLNIHYLVSTTEHVNDLDLIKDALERILNETAEKEEGFEEMAEIINQPLELNRLLENRGD